jgi:hypothetical protein
MVVKVVNIDAWTVLDVKQHQYREAQQRYSQWPRELDPTEEKIFHC